ncbi:anaerobic sulfite reductase subunit C [Moorella thermoacetica]|uniref:Anaerobic sulfite reductase subunit C n=1 Tax=Neomoorella thermoacetica TaxID=1525 RepID=A0A1J5JQN4_NEOTH|nr:anaerobic sulfite reductase subunit C [Moorella thermoacetica]
MKPAMTNDYKDIDFNQLKKGGFIRQQGPDLFIMRLRSIGGHLTSRDLENIARLARKYGRGEVHLTTRQGVEIPGVRLADYQALIAEIQTLQLLPGACGPRIRSIVGCPGKEVCPNGVVDTREMARQVDQAFFGRDVPVKFKIAIAGCHNACTKPRENDIGLQGVVYPQLAADRCSLCGLCQSICPGGAIKIIADRVTIDRQKCCGDGACVASCPTGAWTAGARGFVLYAGGKMGRRPRLGDRLFDFIPEDEVIPRINSILQVFIKYRQGNERLADTIERLGSGGFRELIPPLSREEVAAGGRD